MKRAPSRLFAVLPLIASSPLFAGGPPSVSKMRPPHPAGAVIEPADNSIGDFRPDATGDDIEFEKSFVRFELGLLGTEESLDALKKKLRRDFPSGVLPRSALPTGKVGAYAESEIRVIGALLQMNERAQPERMFAVRRLLEAHGLQNEWKWEQMESQLHGDTKRIQAVIERSRILRPNADFSAEAWAGGSALRLLAVSILRLPEAEQAKLAKMLEGKGEPGFGRDLLAACCRYRSQGHFPVSSAISAHREFIRRLPANELREVVELQRHLQWLIARTTYTSWNAYESPSREEAQSRLPAPKNRMSDADYGVFRELHALAYPESGFEKALGLLDVREFTEWERNVARLERQPALRYLHHALYTGPDEAMSVRAKILERLKAQDPGASADSLEGRLLQFTPIRPADPHVLRYLEKLLPTYGNSSSLWMNLYVERAMGMSLPDFESVEQTAGYLDGLERMPRVAGGVSAFWLCALNMREQETIAVTDFQRHVRPAPSRNLKPTQQMLEARMEKDPGAQCARELLGGIRYANALHATRYEKKAAANALVGNATNAMHILENAMVNGSLPPAGRYALAIRVLDQVSRFSTWKASPPKSLRAASVSALGAYLEEGGANDPYLLRGLATLVDCVATDREEAARAARVLAPHLEPMLRKRPEDFQIEALALLGALTHDRATLALLQERTGVSFSAYRGVTRRLMQVGDAEATSLWLDFAGAPPRPENTTVDGFRVSELGWSSVPEGLSPKKTAFLAAMVAGERNIPPSPEGTDATRVALAKRLIPILRDTADIPEDVRRACCRLIASDLASAAEARPLLRERYDADAVTRFLTARQYVAGARGQADLSCAIALNEFIAGDESPLTQTIASVEAAAAKDVHAEGQGKLILGDLAQVLRRHLEDEFATAQPGHAPEWLSRLSKIIVPLCWYEGGIEKNLTEGRNRLLLMHALYCAATNPDVYNEFIASLSPADLARYRQCWRHVRERVPQLDRVFSVRDPVLWETRSRAMSNIRRMPELLSLLRADALPESGATGAMLKGNLQGVDLVRVEPSLLEPKRAGDVHLDAAVERLVRAKGNGPRLADSLMIAVLHFTPNSAHKAEVTLKRATHLARVMKRPQDARKWLENVPTDALPTDFPTRRDALLSELN